VTGIAGFCLRSGDPAALGRWYRDLDAMAAQLRAAAIAVEFDPEPDLNGRFARRHDPAGNPIELWEPKGCD
jgi:hypothetical protein